MSSNWREARWLRIGPDILDAGQPNRPLFPYDQYREILSPKDCRNAVIDETAGLEEEFGRELVQPFYDLLWLLNTLPNAMTSHSAARGSARYVADPGAMGDYSWARECVGLQCDLFPKAETQRLEPDTSWGIARALYRSIHLADAESKPNASGWYLHIWPQVFDYQVDPQLVDRPAYGVELKMLARVSRFAEVGEVKLFVCSAGLEKVGTTGIRIRGCGCGVEAGLAGAG